MTIHISNSRETSAVRRVHQQGQNYVQYLSIRQSLEENIIQLQKLLEMHNRIKNKRRKKRRLKPLAAFAQLTFLSPHV